MKLTLKSKEFVKSKEKKLNRVINHEYRNSCNEENESCEVLSEYKSTTIIGKKNCKKQRFQCRNYELNSLLDEINRSDVVSSCDLIRNSGVRGGKDDYKNKTGKRNGFSNKFSRRSANLSTGSGSSYSLEHYHQLKNKNKNHFPVHDSSKTSPKLNPIFVWVRQEDTKIVEVVCEDYDYRNRLKLKRTRLGWRAIPKTKRFAEAIVPVSQKVLPEELSESLSTPKKLKKKKKLKKVKNKKSVKEKQKAFSQSSTSFPLCSSYPNNIDKSFEYSQVNNDHISNLKGECNREFLNENISNQLIEESLKKENIDIPLNKIIKSKSCDFLPHTKPVKNFPRTLSLDFSLNFNFNELNNDVILSDTKEANASKIINETVIAEVETDKSAESFVTCSQDAMHSKFETESDQNKHSYCSESNTNNLIVECHKADCDELKQLLKVIPDLELVEENGLEKTTENEWPTPTDLTLPKIQKKDMCCPNVPVFPNNISPLITVTSSTKAPEPLIAPLPEVTITPIPKPAHTKPRNNYLENLLSSVQSVNHDTYNFNVNKQKSKIEKHFPEKDYYHENNNKKFKSEDITLKSLLSRHYISELNDSADSKLKIKTGSEEELSKFSFQKLLTNDHRLDPISQLKEVLSNPFLSVPDPLLVPRARLPALIASPAREIPRLLASLSEKKVEEKLCHKVTDSDILEVSLSNLQTLLSSNSEAIISNKSEDFANYQKLLEPFVEWQKHNSELEKTSRQSKVLEDHTNKVIDLTAATAIGQMLWLRHFNHLDVDANQDLMSFVNFLLNNNFQKSNNEFNASSHKNISPVSKPSSFVPPLSPLSRKSHLNTLAMWQDVFSLHQNSEDPQMNINNSTGYLKDSQRNEKLRSQHVKRQHFQLNDFFPVSEFPKEKVNYFPLDGNQEKCEIPKLQRKTEQNLKPKSQSSFNRISKSLGHHTKDDIRQKCNEKKKAQPYISVKPLSNLVDRRHSFDDRKNHFKKLEEDSNQKGNVTEELALRLQQFNTQIHKTQINLKEVWHDWPNQDRKSSKESCEVPKLKVKNLVDPNVSPPKLLKRIAPQHLPIVTTEQESISETGQSQLWHPLFGSNQVKDQSYSSSPWHWTTVTVNGE